MLTVNNKMVLSFGAGCQAGFKKRVTWESSQRGGQSNYFPDYNFPPPAVPSDAPGNPYKLCLYLVGQEGREEAGGYGEQEQEQPETKIAERDNNV